MYIVYQLGVYSYYLFVLFASLFNRKAKQWIQGRVEQKTKFNTPLPQTPRIWYHFASLGEFEQGRNVLEQIKKEYPNYSIVVTFFSPSGFEVRKNYALAEKVYYLPLDTPSNAKLVFDHIQPSLIFFTKYEYWFNYFKEANKRGIPLFIISSIFRKEQLFFKAYGSFQRKILCLVTHFFVQNQESIDLLYSIKITNCSIAGDTRFDRVYEHSLNPVQDNCIAEFCKSSSVFVAGSSWPKDEELIKELLTAFPLMKFIFVPHEVNQQNINSLKAMFGNEADLYTKHKSSVFPSNKRVMIVDTVGLLNSIYQYATYCYVGGGFGVGIHNTLEAAAYGKPVFFGPNYQKFSEAKSLIQINASKSISSSSELIEQIKLLEGNNASYLEKCTAAKHFVLNEKGATEKIITHLKKENYLLS